MKTIIRNKTNGTKMVFSSRKLTRKTFVNNKLFSITHYPNLSLYKQSLSKVLEKCNKKNKECTFRISTIYFL